MYKTNLEREQNSQLDLDFARNQPGLPTKKGVMICAKNGNYSEAIGNLSRSIEYRS